MRRFWLCTGAITAGTALAMALTLLLPSLGFPLWHYHAAFAALLVGAAAAWPMLQRRRVATMAMVFTGILATATGFVMLYSKQLPLKEWVTWWHSVASFTLLLAFLVHWLHNHPRLLTFTKRILAPRRATALVAAGVWLGILVFAAWTFTPEVRSRFTSANYLFISGWTVVAGVALPYGIWFAYRHPALRARLRTTAHRNDARALVDTSLFLANWGALLTGFALLYFSDFLRAGSLKYVSKWWHTATSVAFLALVALHVGFNARLVRAHARRLDDDLR